MLCRMYVLYDCVMRCVCVSGVVASVGTARGNGLFDGVGKDGGGRSCEGVWRTGILNSSENVWRLDRVCVRTTNRIITLFIEGTWTMFLWWVQGI